MEASWFVVLWVFFGPSGSSLREEFETDLPLHEMIYEKVPTARDFHFDTSYIYILFKKIIRKIKLNEKKEI